MERIVFNRGMKDVAGTKPQRLRLGDWYCEPSTWAKAMEMTAKALLFDVRYRDRLLKNLRSIRGFDAVSAGMHLPRKLDSNLYLECNRSANGCLRTIRLLLEAAAFPSDEASVEYTEAPRAETEETNSKQSATVDKVAVAPPPPKMTGPEPYTAYPKRELFAALAEDRIPDEDFDKLLTLDGTRALLGMTPRHNTPVFSLAQQQFFWRDPATRRGKPVFVTAQWFERDKARLDKLLARWQTNSKGMSVTSPIETKLSDLLQTDFPNGFRPSSIIDRNKFRRLYDQKFGAELPQNFDFESILPSLAFCRDNDEVTMEELLHLEQEFGLGGGNRSISTAHEEMVRVSEERFVAPRFVPFDVAAIDAALESLVPPSGVLPLLSVRSFVSFPAISGLGWNVYLLEAFLRRASASFAYLSVSAAPRTACGAIVRRSAGFATFTDALARAVVEAGVSANEKEVGDFLIAQRYIQRRRGVEKDVAEMARRLTRSESEGDVR